MSNFVEYKEFISFDLAADLLSLLDQNDIKYEIDDSSMRFSLVPYENLNGKVIVKIQGTDIQKADELILMHVPQKEVGHFLNMFSDEDLIDVIANPYDWTDKEVNIAQDLITQRGIVVSAEVIKLARKDQSRKIEEEKPVVLPNKSYVWFMWIGILSIINSILIISKANLRFMFGLGYTQIIDGLFYNASQNVKIIGLLISVLSTSIFFLIWYYAKLKNPWAYLIGIILYSLDMLIFIVYKDWLNAGFHVYVLLLLIFGYSRLLKTKQNVG